MLASNDATRSAGVSSNTNTVHLVARIVAVVGSVGCGHAAWCERLTCHLGILRLMTRGLARRRRFGLSLASRYRSACCHGASGS